MFIKVLDKQRIGFAWSLRVKVNREHSRVSFVITHISWNIARSQNG